ncbi:MAG: hypothetical protein KC996_04745 [Phycisphaerales bacterium]|nr:hypothetical protein [Phycisphaerales bacterium]
MRKSAQITVVSALGSVGDPVVVSVVPNAYRGIVESVVVNETVVSVVDASVVENVVVGSVVNLVVGDVSVNVRVVSVVDSAVTVEVVQEETVSGNAEKGCVQSVVPSTIG